VQHLLEPLVVSWGWEPERTNLLNLDGEASRFALENEWQGTRDPAAYLSVPAAIRFQAEHDWPRVRAECHELLRKARRRIEELTGLPPICPDTGRPGFHTRPGAGGNGILPDEWYAQMAVFPLPACDAGALQRRLWEEYRIEVKSRAADWPCRPAVRQKSRITSGKKSRYCGSGPAAVPGQNPPAKL
jgi:isopenicillin-N epimerase